MRKSFLRKSGAVMLALGLVEAYTAHLPCLPLWIGIALLAHAGLAFACSWEDFSCAARQR